MLSLSEVLAIVTFVIPHCMWPLFPVSNGTHPTISPCSQYLCSNFQLFVAYSVLVQCTFQSISSICYCFFRQMFYQSEMCSFHKVNKVASVVVCWTLTWAFYPHQELCTFHISSELWLKATNLCLFNKNYTILGKASKLFLKPSLFRNPLNTKWPTFAMFALPTFHCILWKMELPVQ